MERSMNVSHDGATAADQHSGSSLHTVNNDNYS